MQQNADQTLGDARTTVAVQHIPRDGSDATAHDQRGRMQDAQLAQHDQTDAKHPVTVLRHTVAQGHQWANDDWAEERRCDGQHFSNLFFIDKPNIIIKLYLQFSN